jgi:subtilisin-like proprotein convertase family protein
MRKILFLCLFFLSYVSNFSSSAQCLTAPNGQWPSSAFTPTCSGGIESITSSGWNGEYSVVNVVSGSIYVFSSSVATDYVTISNSAGTTALIFGQASVIWSANFSGQVRFYTHGSSACTAGTTSRSRRVQCTLPFCATPATQPTALSLSSTTPTSVNVSFTPGTDTPTGYLVIRTNSSVAPTNPTNGTTYVVGSSILGGVVVYQGASSSFTDNTTLGGNQYYYWLYSYNLTGGCQISYNTSSPLNGSITTSACPPTVSPISNRVVCSGSTTSVTFTGAVTGTVFNWSNTNASIGLATSGSGNISFTASNTTADPIDGTITVTPEVTGCQGDPISFTITVNPKGQVNTVSNQALCNGSATSAVTFTTTNNGLISTGGTQNASSGTISISVPDASAVGATATIPVTLPTGAVINNMRVTLNMTHTWISDMVINLKAPNGQVLNLFNQHGGAGDNLVNTVVSSTGTTSLASGTPPYTGTFAATAAIGQGPTGYTSNAANFAALYSTPNGNWVLAMRDLFGGDLGLLTSWSISFDYTVQGTFGTNMNWTNSLASIGLGASGTGNIPSFTAVNNGSAPVTSTVTVTPVYFNGGTSCAGTPSTFTYTVNPTPSLNAVNNQVLCASTPANIALTGPVSGTVYTWTNSNTAIGLGASGTGNLVFTPTTGTTPTIATITATPSTLASGGAVSLSPAPTNMMAYRANIGTVYSMTLTGATGGSIWGTNVYTDDSYLSTAAVHAGVLSVGQTATVYVEVMPGQSSYTPSTQNGITSYSWGAWGGSYKFLTTAPSPGVPGCTGTPRTFTIMVNPVGQVNTVSSQVLCNGSNTTAVNFATVNGGGTIVAGTPVTANSGTIAVTVPDANAAGISSTLPVTLPAGATITGVSVNFNMTHTWVSDMVFNLKAPNGQILNLVNRRGGSGDNFTNTTISSTGTAVLATAPFTGTFAADAAIGVGPTGQVSGAANFAGLYSTGTGDWTLWMRDYAGGDIGTLTNWSITISYTILQPAVTSYAWTNNTPSIGLAASGSGNIASFAAVNTSAAPVTASVTVTPTYTNNGAGCAGTPITYTYTVNPTPTVNAVNNQTVCRGSNTSAVTFTGATTGTVYNWTNSNTAIGLAASGTGNIPSFAGTNTTAAPITGTITVTPVYTNAGVTCTGTPRTFTITVNPIPTVNPVASFPVCHNNVAAATFSGATTGTVFSWTNSNPAIGLAASGTGNISFTAINTTSAPVTATITVTPSFTNGGTTCVGIPTSFVITVNPLPVVTTGTLPARVCISDTLVRLNGTPVGGSWSGFGISGYNFVPPATAVGAWPITYTYADANGCVNRATTTVTVQACEERNRDLDNGAVILYPNPNSGQFNIRINSALFNVLGAKVYNSAGQLVYTNQWRSLVFGRVIPVNLNNLAAGIYMVRLYYGDGMDRGADKTYQIVIAR